VIGNYSGDCGRTRSLCLLPRIDPVDFTKAKMNIELRKTQKDTQPSRTFLVLKNSSNINTQLSAICWYFFSIGDWGLGSTIKDETHLEVANSI